MGRPIFSYELTDPDFAWLLDSYRESHPDSLILESPCLPVVLLTDVKGRLPELEPPAEESSPEVLTAPPPKFHP